MFLVPDASSLAPMPPFAVSDVATVAPMFRSAFISCERIPIREIEVGEARYRLRRPLQGAFVTELDGSCKFWVEGFSPLFLGSGSLGADAYNDWRNQVHEAFQELYGKRPFEMTRTELHQWEILENLIDVVGYQNETPILIRQLGQVMDRARLQVDWVNGRKVTRVHRGPRQIAWADGRKESVDIELAPPEFAGFKPGQPFEAVAERDPITGELRRLRYVQPVTPLRELSDRELRDFWTSLPATSTLPKSTRDWSRR